MTRDHTHAYLVLLRVEVAAFHPALSGLNKSNPSSRLHRNGVCLKDIPPPQTRLCGPSPQRSQMLAHPLRRTVVNRYPALWSPDLPRCHEDTATAQSALRVYCKGQLSGISDKYIRLAEYAGPDVLRQ